MKAVHIQNPNEWAVIEFPEPEPSDDEVLIKVKAVGICGSDIHIYEWTRSYKNLRKYFPLVLGHEFSGEVVKVGEQVSNFKINDRVTSEI